MVWSILFACGAEPTPAPTDADTDTDTDTDADADSDADTDPPTLDHRPEAPVCGERPLPAEPTCPAGDTGSSCAVHADCTAGPSGTCILGGPDYNPTCFCTYDTCYSDADCGGGAVCACADDPRFDQPTNTCLASSGCRVDADCASGLCQANHGFNCGTAGPGIVVPISDWQCATADDTCNGDEDCDPTFGDRCIFDDGRFQCSSDYVAACE
ncbi:MAG: hypothetical protein ABMB14_19390 [Myxococcota bacterium]